MVELLKPDLVTILIGVNDLVQRRPAEHYRASLVTIYDHVGALGLPPGRAVATSIPDWSVVPAARNYGDVTRIRFLTEAFNYIAHEEADSRGFKWIDITAVSLSGLGSAGWIASDDLHPGDSQYAAWAEVIWRAISTTWE